MGTVVSAWRLPWCLRRLGGNSSLPVISSPPTRMSDDTLLDPSLQSGRPARRRRSWSFRQQPEAKGFRSLAPGAARRRAPTARRSCARPGRSTTDPLRAADAWSEAGEAMSCSARPRPRSNTCAPRSSSIRRTIARPIGRSRSSSRDDPAAAVEIRETELSELRRVDSARPRAGRSQEVRAHRSAARAHHRRAAGLWNDHLGRVDRALWHCQQAWKLEPHRTEALEAARETLRQLARRRRDGRPSSIRPSSSVLGQQRCDRAESRDPARARQARAANARTSRPRRNHLEEASRLDPTSLETAECARRDLREPGLPRRSDAPQGRRAVRRARPPPAQRARRLRPGINYLRRAVGVDPYAKGSVARARERRSRRAVAMGPSSTACCATAARSCRIRPSARISAPPCCAVSQPAARFATVCATSSLELVRVRSAGHRRPCVELKELLRDDKEWDQLARLMEAEVTGAGLEPPRDAPTDDLVTEILELATIAREHLGDRDRAAELLHQALRQSRRRTGGGARPLRRSLPRTPRLARADRSAPSSRSTTRARPASARRGPRASPRGDRAARRAPPGLHPVCDRRVAAYRRATSPVSPKVTEALRRLTARGKMWSSSCLRLEHELASAGDPVTRMHSLKKMAQTYRERQLEPRRAIELYEQVLGETLSSSFGPESSGARRRRDALKALAELYEKEGDDAGARRDAAPPARFLDAQRLSSQLAKMPCWPRALMRRRSGRSRSASERLTVLRRLAISSLPVRGSPTSTAWCSRAARCSSCSPAIAMRSSALERVLEKANYRGSSRRSSITRPRRRARPSARSCSSGSPSSRPNARTTSTRSSDGSRRCRRRRRIPTRSSRSASSTSAQQRWPELAQIIERSDGGRRCRNPARRMPRSAPSISLRSW